MRGTSLLTERLSAFEGLCYAVGFRQIAKNSGLDNSGIEIRCCEECLVWSDMFYIHRPVSME
jgi:hypothetical protein